MRWALLAAFASAASAQTGSIRGTVVDSATHRPVRRAVVSFHSTVNPGERRSVTTDGAGMFVFDRLAPGIYPVNATHPTYPQTFQGGVTKSVSVKADQEATLTLELIPGASVSGHILDEDGDPLQGCVAQAVPIANRQFGFSFGRIDGGVPSDSEYRLFGIMPGKYYVVAQCQTPVFEPRPLSSGPDPPPSAGYPKLYYPSATTPESAQLLELAAGEELSGIDLRMKPVAVSHIRVTPVGADWRGRKDLMWQLIPTVQEQWGVFGGWQPVDTSKGFFEVPQVFAGSYRLMVTSNGTFQRPRNGSDDSLIGGVQPVEVLAADAGRTLETAIPLRPGVDLTGIIEREGGSAGKPPQFDQFNILVISEFGAGANAGPVKEDGTFLLQSVFPGVGRLHVDVPSGFMKRAWMGNTEVTEGRIDLSSGAQGPLRILVSMNTASIRGTAPPGSAVGLVSTGTDGDRVRNFQTGADRNGQFTFSGLAPGKYRIGIDLQPAPFSSEAGREIVVAEGDTLVVDDLTDK